MILQLRNITKEVNGRKILNNINVNFKQGLTIIKGESGSGKSTLLNIIGAIDNNYSGVLVYNDELITKKTSNYYRKHYVSFIFQNYNLIESLNIKDNIRINSLILNKKTNIKDGNLNIKNINSSIKNLSGGEKQRIAILRSIHIEKDIIICDEPTGALDQKNAKEVMEILKSLSKTKIVIVVTHSSKYDYLADKIINITDGQIDMSSHEKINYKKIKHKNKKIKFKNILYLSFKNIKKKLIKNLGISLATSIGITSIVLMLTISKSTSLFLNNTFYEYSNPNLIEVNKLVNEEMVSFDDIDIKKLSNIEGVNSYILSSSIYNANNKINQYNIDIIETIISKDIKLIKGSYPNNKQILINETLSNKIKVNEKVKLLINDNKYDYIVSGIYSDNLKTVDYNTIYFNYNDLESIVGSLSNTSIHLNIKNQNIKSDVKEKIKNLGYNLSYQEESLDTFNEVLDVVSYLLIFVSCIALFVASIMIFTIFYISVIERTKEIGILKSLGFLNKDIKKLFLCDSMILGVLSGMISCLFSYLLIVIGKNVLYDFIGATILIINYNYFLLGMILSVLLTVVSSLYPSYKAARKNIVDALKYE